MHGMQGAYNTGMEEGTIMIGRMFLPAIVTGIIVCIIRIYQIPADYMLIALLVLIDYDIYHSPTGKE
jgi:hypothetical protein